jgi:hypothetical protein
VLLITKVAYLSSIDTSTLGLEYHISLASNVKSLSQNLLYGRSTLQSRDDLLQFSGADLRDGRNNVSKLSS